MGNVWIYSEVLERRYPLPLKICTKILNEKEILERILQYIDAAII